MFSPNGIKAILFDLDGTLRFHAPTGSDVFNEYVLQLGIPLTEEDKIRALRWEHYYFASSPEIRADQKTFKDSRTDFWVNFSRRRLIALGLHHPQAIELSSQASAYMAEVYKPQVYVPDDARSILPILKEAGYVLGVVSNREKPYQGELEELGLSPHFHFSLAGGEIPAYKPDAAIFQRALELSGTNASEAIYIGDNYFADIVGSRLAGLWPVLYDPIHLFPDAECAVIRSFDELPGIIKSI